MSNIDIAQEIGEAFFSGDLDNTEELMFNNNVSLMEYGDIDLITLKFSHEEPVIVCVMDDGFAFEPDEEMLEDILEER